MGTHFPACALHQEPFRAIVTWRCDDNGALLAACKDKVVYINRSTPRWPAEAIFPSVGDVIDGYLAQRSRDSAHENSCGDVQIYQTLKPAPALLFTHTQLRRTKQGGYVEDVMVDCLVQFSHHEKKSGSRVFHNEFLGNVYDDFFNILPELTKPGVTYLVRARYFVFTDEKRKHTTRYWRILRLFSSAVSLEPPPYCLGIVLPSMFDGTPKVCTLMGDTWLMLDLMPKVLEPARERLGEWVIAQIHQDPDGLYRVYSFHHLINYTLRACRDEQYMVALECQFLGAMTTTIVDGMAPVLSNRVVNQVVDGRGIFYPALQWAHLWCHFDERTGQWMAVENYVPPPMPPVPPVAEHRYSFTPSTAAQHSHQPRGSNTSAKPPTPRSSFSDAPKQRGPPRSDDRAPRSIETRRVETRPPNRNYPATTQRAPSRSLYEPPPPPIWCQQNEENRREDHHRHCADEQDRLDHEEESSRYSANQYAHADVKRNEYSRQKNYTTDERRSESFGGGVSNSNEFYRDTAPDVDYDDYHSYPQEHAPPYGANAPRESDAFYENFENAGCSSGSYGTLPSIEKHRSARNVESPPPSSSHLPPTPRRLTEDNCRYACDLIRDVLRRDPQIRDMMRSRDYYVPLQECLMHFSS